MRVELEGYWKVTQYRLKIDSKYVRLDAELDAEKRLTGGADSIGFGSVIDN